MNRWSLCIGITLLAVWCVGMFGRGLWTPDEPREADIAWRMSWQSDKAVPLLAGAAFCEKPPLTYWVAAVPIRLFGLAPWALRLPNLLYAALSTLCIGLLAGRAAGRVAAGVAAAALATFLLSYQVAIWFATDAPLLAFDSLALLGAYIGFYAGAERARLTGYTLMHLGLALGFLSKSAIAWLVPTLTLVSLIVWERRWRELLRWELYAGFGLQAALIGAWIWFVYAGPDGPARLKVFFWNNLAGRLTTVDAPAELQYASGHRNSPGKYWIELPLYLWPWTLLVPAALRRAWQFRRAPLADTRAPRFAIAASLPALLLLSFAATARNVYAAPALPGFAVLLGWWASRLQRIIGTWDVRAIRGSAVVLAIGALLAATACVLFARDLDAPGPAAGFDLLLAALGTAVSLYLCARAWRFARAGGDLRAFSMLFYAYGSLLVATCVFAYGEVDRWQDLAALGAAIKRDTQNHPLLLYAPDETTRAFVDLYVDTRARPVQRLADAPAGSRVLVELPGREYGPTLSRLRALAGSKAGPAADPAALTAALAAGFTLDARPSLPNGRRYALLRPAP